MAHGSAGIAMTLLRLHRETGDDWMLESARAGLAHERDHFHPVDRQWPNLQEPEGRVSFMNGWCAGAAGIGLSRLAAARLLPDDAAIPEEIEAAIDATRRQLGGYQHHLCCGEAGRIAFLAAAGYDAEAREAAVRMAESFRNLGYWRLQEFTESLPIPGLPGGVAGVGLALISAAHPSCSEVLTLS
jgi:lantibiotic modifying enzyme